MPPTAADAAKISMRVEAALWSAWCELAQRAGFDSVDYIKVAMRKEVMRAMPSILGPKQKERMHLLDQLNHKIIEIARGMFPHEFSQNFTLDVFRRAMLDEQFVRNYRYYIGGADPYVHGNALKDVNRDLGWRIKNSVGAEVMKDKAGKPIQKRNLKGEIIQSYTLLKLKKYD